jgi:hypothetical protein
MSSDCENIGSISSSAAIAGSINISSSDPALVVTEPSQGNFNLDFNAELSKIPYLRIEYSAGENISALKAVYVKASDGKAYVGKSNGTVAEGLVIGLALNAAVTNDPVDVILLGVLEDLSWSWSANELLFLSTSGSITSIAPSLPTDTYSVVLGKALTSTKIMVSIDSPITL